MTEKIATTFAEMALAPALHKIIADVGYETPSPIQAQSIPPLLEGRDLLGQAQTGVAALNKPIEHLAAEPGREFFQPVGVGRSKLDRR